MQWRGVFVIKTGTFVLMTKRSTIVETIELHADGEVHRGGHLPIAL